MKINIAFWVEKNGQLYPDKEALVVSGRSVTYRELADRVARLAAALDRAGLRRGDRVAALLLNSIEYVELLFACAGRGLLLVPLNFRLSAGELAFILSDCTPRALFHDPFFAGLVEPLRAADSPVELWIETPLAGGGRYDQLLAEHPAGLALDPGVGGEDDLLLMYTAGTTGRAKGVVLTHENCFFQTINGWALGNSPDAVTLVVLPLFHVGGLNGSVTPMVHIGATTILIPRFEAAEVLRIIEERRVQGVMAVPTVYQVLIDHPDFERRDLTSLKVLISGGAPLPHALIERYHSLGMEMRQGYGLTEASPGVTGMGPGDCRRKPGTVGKPCLYTEVRVADERLSELPPGTVGEIVVRGPNVMKGYWKLPEESARTIVDGWLLTGDLGTMDAERYLTIVGRKKEMIISGGENIYPAEVEQALATHPAVGLVAVVGRSDERWGEVPVAFVQPRPGMSVTAAQLAAHVATRLGRFKQPQEYFIRESLPVSAAGKVLKRELAAESGG